MTGYQVQIVAGCNVTESLLAEVEVYNLYNQVMRDRHARNGY